MSRLALALGRPYLRWSARRRLDGVWITGLQHARDAVARGPVVFAANHVSWWDGCLGVLADPVIGADSAFLVDAAGLARVPFLRWFGAIALDRSSALSARAGLSAAVRWLDAPRRALWIYPQGRQRPAHLRPLGLHRGVDWIARRSGAAVIPVAIQYGWREDHRPAAALALGPPGPADPGALEAALIAQLAQLDAAFDGAWSLDPLLDPPRARIDAGAGARVLTLGARRLP